MLICMKRLPQMFVVSLAAQAFGSAMAQNLPPPKDAPYLGAIELKVDATDVDHKVLRVREALPVQAGPLTLLYPQWIPGNHAPTNHVKRLAALRIEANGKPLAWRRNPDNFHALSVDVPAGVSRLDLQFQQVLPAEAAGYDAYIGRKIIDVQWQGAVLYPAGHYASRIEVDASLRLPAGWQHGSALRPAASARDELRFERVSLETLLDSPVFAGMHAKRVDLDPGSARPIFLDLFAEDPASLDMKDEHVAAYRSLVQQADRLFGARHFAHYDMLLAIGDEVDSLGLEHHQSSENGVKSGYFKDWATTPFARYITPHEFVHSWNGKFRRPADLWTPDFNTTARNSLLWVYEGQTEYWGEVLSARSGMISLADMRERFARTAAWAQHGNPGRNWRSLQTTTDDEITAGRELPLEWPSLQRFEDYYSEGMLIWLDVDTRIRELSGGKRSLDDFARGFFGVEDGRVAPLLYTFDDVVAELQRVQPFDWAGFLRAKLDAIGPDAPIDGLARAGWRLAWTAQQSEVAKTAAAYYERADFSYSLGLQVGKDGRITDVLWDGPAYRAGLAKGPTLLAVNLRGYKPDVLQDAITAASSGTQPVELLLKEGDDFRVVRIDYRGGLRYPTLERIEGKPDLLTPLLSAR